MRTVTRRKAGRPRGAAGDRALEGLGRVPALTLRIPLSLGRSFWQSEVLLHRAYAPQPRRVSGTHPVPLVVWLQALLARAPCVLLDTDLWHKSC